MQHCKIRGNDLYYEVINPDREQTILMVHGHPFDHTMWRYQHEALSHYRLVLPDLKGYGRSAVRADKIFIEDQALELALLLDELNIREVHVIGLSMGGQIVVEFARLFPHRTLSLVLCDSNPSSETNDSYQNRLQLANRIEAKGMKEYTHSDIDHYVHPQTAREKGTAYRHLTEMMLNTSKEGAAASHRGRAERRNNYSFLPELRIPCLVVGGEADYFTPPAEMEGIALQIPKAQFVLIKGSGHLPNMEQPEAFNEAIIKFYKAFSENTRILREFITPSPRSFLPG